MQIHAHNYEFHEFIFRQHHNRFTKIFSPIVLDTCIVLLLTNTYTHGCNDFSRLVTALHSKSESVSFIVLTANLSMELGHFSTISNSALLSISVLGDAVPPTQVVSKHMPVASLGHQALRRVF